MNQSEDTHLVWMDLEMTGLEPAQDTILEIATIITDAQLNVVAEGPVYAIHQSDAVLEAMSEWPKKTHAASGLTQRVREAQVSMAQAEADTVAFIQQYVKRGVSPLCGNSIHQDRRFLNKYMPDLESYLHYRNLDVSTVKELARRWYPDIFKKVQKKEAHLALDDIRESIDELKFYRATIFK